MDLVDFTIALTQATRMGTEDLVLPDGRGARGRMTADATEESRSGGESRTQSRRRLEVQAALLVDGSRRCFASARGVMTLLMGEETCVNVERLLLQASEGELALCALEVQVSASFARGRAVRVLQAALRLWLRRGLWYVHGRPAQPGVNADTGQPTAYRPCVRPGSTEMWEARFATMDAQLQRMRHGVALAWEVHDVAAKRGLPFDRRIPGRPTFAASGWQLAIESSLEMARAHASRRVQWAFRWRQLMRTVHLLSAVHTQLKLMRAARKAGRAASRVRARAAADESDLVAPRSGCECAQGGEGGAAPTAPQAASSGWRQQRALLALPVAAVAAVLLAVEGTRGAATMHRLASVPQHGGRLPRPPGVRFSEWDRAWSDALETRGRWLHACQGGKHQGDLGAGQDRMVRWRRVADIPHRAWGWGAFVRLLRNSPQPASSCELTRLAAGPWALPRPPEPCLMPEPSGRAGSGEAAWEGVPRRRRIRCRWGLCTRARQTQRRWRYSAEGQNSGLAACETLVQTWQTHGQFRGTGRRRRRAEGWGIRRPRLCGAGVTEAARFWRGFASELREMSMVHRDSVAAETPTTRMRMNGCRMLRRMTARRKGSDTIESFDFVNHSSWNELAR